MEQKMSFCMHLQAILKVFVWVWRPTFIFLWLQPLLLIKKRKNLCELSHSNVYAWKQTHVLGPNREERNEPANARLSVEFIAKIKGIDVAEVIRVTSANAKRLF
nr:unnamed protein product [Meloidogyne enterolobii]